MNSPVPARVNTPEAAEFYRRLQQVTTCIHDTENLSQLMLDVSPDICSLFNADRLTLYAVSEDKTAIVSRVKTGLTTSKELKLPIGPQSIAGFVALTRQTLNIKDVYDDAELAAIDSRLHFLKEVDRRSGYRTRQMLVAPILDGAELKGVLQVINSKISHPFGALEMDGVVQLCKTLATAIRQRANPTESPNRVLVSKYDGLVANGVLSADELRRSMQLAREQNQSVERIMMAEYHAQPDRKSVV